MNHKTWLSLLLILTLPLFVSCTEKTEVTINAPVFKEPATTPTKDTTNYMNDMMYCEEDADCINFRGCCGCFPKNKYHKPKVEMDCSVVDCLESPDLEECKKEVKCLNNQCEFKRAE